MSSSSPFHEVLAQPVQLDGRQVSILQSGSPLWHLAHSLGEQVLIALDDLGFVRTGPLGKPLGFRIQELAVTPDASRVVIHLDVTSLRLYDPILSQPTRRGRPVPYLHLVNDTVIEQVRVRVSELMGGRVDVWADNHYYVRYVVDLRRLDRPGDPFPSGLLTDHIAAAPGPLHLPLGLDQNDRLLWLDLRQGRHALLTGATGGGKSTWIDGAICSLVRHSPPDRLQLAFFDGQRLNFSPYRALSSYRFADREGRMDILWQPDDVVAAMVRLDREHRRRVELIGETPWSCIEEYNDHADTPRRLPYVALFTDELAVLRAGMSRSQSRAFDQALLSLILGGRKVGFRLFLCLQYLKGTVLSPEIAAQAALTLAFWNSPQGSKNSLGDTTASMLPGHGRFIVAGLPGGRRTLQGLYVDRETVLALLADHAHRPTFPVDSILLDLLAYALRELDGALSRDALARAFGHLMSPRQVNRLLHALERVGLALPPDRSTVPPQPRRLTVSSLEDAVAVLQFHPELCFLVQQDGDGGGDRLVLAPQSVRMDGCVRMGSVGPPPRSDGVRNGNGNGNGNEHREKLQEV